MPRTRRSRSWPRALALLLTLVVGVPAVAGAVELDLAIVASPDPVAPGEVMAIFLTVTNQSGSNSDAVRLELLFPAEFSPLLLAALSDGGECTNSNNPFVCEVGETVFWNLGVLPSGAGLTVMLPPTVGAGVVPPEIISLDAEVFEDGETRGTFNRTVAVESSPRLGLSVDADREPVTAGEELTYQLTYGNRSSTSTTDTTLTFPLPTGTTLVAASGDGISNGSEVVWDLGTLQGHTTSRRSVTVLVEDGILSDGDLVEVDAAVLAGEADLEVDEARATVATRVESGAPLMLSVALNPAPAEPGEMLVTELTVSNTSDSPVFNVQVELFYPAGLLSLRTDTLSDSGGCTNISNNFVCEAGEIVFWDLGTLGPGGGKTVFLPPTVGSLPGGELIRHAARVFADNEPSTHAFRTVRVDSARRFDLAVDADREPAGPGEELTYFLTYGNRSTNATTGTTLAFPLPEGTSFVEASGEGALVDSTVSWDLGTLPANAVGRESITVRVEDGILAAEEVLVEGAALTDGDLIEVDTALLSGEADFQIDETYASRTTRVESGGPLTLSVAPNPDPAEPGEALVTELTVSNRGTNSVLNVRLQLLTPAGLLGLAKAALLDGGDCIDSATGNSSACEAGEIVFWDLGTLPPGGGQTVSLPPVVASPPADTLVRFMARAIADSQPSARAFHTVAVAPVRHLDLSVDADREPVTVGTELTYDLSYGNRTFNSSSNTTLTFPFPVGTSFVSATGGGVDMGSEVVWDLGVLPAHFATRESVTVMVDDSLLDDGDVVEVNGAALRGDADFQARATRAVSTVRVQSIAPLSLSLVASPDPALLGDTLLTELTVANETQGTLFNVRVELLFPPQLFELSYDFISEGGECNVVAGSNLACSGGETVFWDLSTLVPGFEETLSLPPMVRNDGTAPPYGSLIRFRSQAFSDVFGKTVDTIAVLVTPPPALVEISDEVIAETVLYEACNTISFFNSVILAGVHVRLRAPQVIFGDGTEVRAGARLTVFNDLPRGCL